jgi:hypothetical protein
LVSRGGLAGNAPKLPPSNQQVGRLQAAAECAVSTLVAHAAPPAGQRA